MARERERGSGSGTIDMLLWMIKKIVSSYAFIKYTKLTQGLRFGFRMIRFKV